MAPPVVFTPLSAEPLVGLLSAPKTNWYFGSVTRDVCSPATDMPTKLNVVLLDEMCVCVRPANFVRSDYKRQKPSFVRYVVTVDASLSFVSSAI